MTWDTALYLAAHRQVLASQEDWDQGSCARALIHSVSARFAYVANLIVNVASFPLAILYVTFGAIMAIAHWDLKIEVYTKSFNWIKTKTNHILLSTLGVLLPAAAHHYRDANLAPYVIALRVAIITWGLLWALRR